MRIHTRRHKYPIEALNIKTGESILFTDTLVRNAILKRREHNLNFNVYKLQSDKTLIYFRINRKEECKFY